MIDVIVVNWNSGAQLMSCISSVVEYGDGLVCKIFVVDNGSIDGSVDAVKCFLNIQVIKLNDNNGFGRACNIGARFAESEFLLFLNPDAALCENTLSITSQYMRDPNNFRVGICGVKLFDRSGQLSRSCSRFPSVFGFIAHATGLALVMPRYGHAMGEWDHEQIRKVDQVIGAYFLVRRDVFESLNGFDERFFVYYEEVDFSYRAHKAGWESVYLADAEAFHAGGGTSEQVKAMRLFYSLRSRLLYVNKNFSWFGSITTYVVTLFFEPFSRSILAVRRRSLLDLKDTLDAYGLLWGWMFKRLMPTFPSFRR